ncbi:spore germination protein [Thalassorhabdus alkalitolerans]|uniref:Spore germination protein n=1 Tax=Thalassorhabdus alkalitolerans TaxID=2282697 RepID=A0ABW0YTP1_9BACI
MSQQVEEKQSLFPQLHKNEKLLTERLGIGTSYDVGIRKLNILGKEIQIYYVNGLSNDQYVIEILRELMLLESRGREVHDVQKAIENHLTHVQVEYKDTFEDCITELLSGLAVILMEGKAEAFIVDVRNYPGRGPEEPDTEKVVRGARDGYTENIVENTALTRRRIRDPNLRNEMLRIGTRSQTDVCLSYIDGIADPALVEIVRKELESINIDGLSMADKVVEEYIVKQGNNPFPLVRYTERPDVAATHLLEGHVVVIVDASPSVIITPTTMFHHVQHAEEYRQAPAIGTFFRWVRFLGILAGVFLVPLWLLMVLSPEMLPEMLDYIGPDNGDQNVPIFAQILIAEFGIELLRMAAIHTPSPLATALGLVAALLIGEIAIEVGLFTAEVILYIAAGAVGLFATPSYELGVALKISRLVLIVLVFLFEGPGFIIGTTIIFLLVCAIRSLNKPYLWPFLPFAPKEFWQIIVRTTVPTLRFRPKIVDPQDPIKQS